MRRTVQEHQDAVMALLGHPLGGNGDRVPDRLPLAAALGRVSAIDVRAAVDLPPFDNSQMDGFAVCTTDTDPGAPLRVAAPVPAGFVALPWRPGTAVPVMTGAMIPAGADAVVPIEAAQPAVFPDPEDLTATVRLPAAPLGQFIRRAGSDLAAGHVAVAAGEVLTPAVLALLAATGVTEVDVRPRFRVLLLSTGDEIVAPGEALETGKIYDSNSVLLGALLAEAGVEVTPAALVPDRPDHFLALLRHALRSPVDLVLTTGGISAGAYEVVRQALAGQDVMFVSVAMQPGGPQGIGLVDGVPFLGFPGNPVSGAVSFEMFLRPALAALTGVPGRIRTTATLVGALDSPHGKVQLRRGRYVPGNGGRGVVHLIGGASSHLLASLAASNALIRIPADVTTLPDGADVEVLLL